MTIEPYNYNDEPSGRTDTLIQALEKIERLEKQIEIAVEALEFYEKPFSCFSSDYNIAQHYKKAAEALVKIKEMDK